MNDEVRSVGIDSSTKRTGISLFINGKYKWHKLVDKSHISDIDFRINEMGKEIINTLQQIKPTMVFIERPQGYGKNVDLVRKLAEVMGFVRIWCIMSGVYYEECNPSVWRKYIGIQQGKKKRAELKAESIAYVKKVYGIDCTDDEADSICLCGAMINKYKGEQGK